MKRKERNTKTKEQNFKGNSQENINSPDDYEYKTNMKLV